MPSGQRILSCIMHFLWFVLIFLLEGGFSFLFEGRKKGKTVGFKNQYLKYLFFPFFFLWCLWGYNTLSGICLVFYSISPFQNVRGVCFSPLHPLQRFMGPIIIHLFVSIWNNQRKQTRGWISNTRKGWKTDFPIYGSSRSHLRLFYQFTLVNYWALLDRWVELSVTTVCCAHIQTRTQKKRPLLKREKFFCLTAVVRPGVNIYSLILEKTD